MTDRKRQRVEAFLTVGSIRVKVGELSMDGTEIVRSRVNVAKAMLRASGNVRRERHTNRGYAEETLFLILMDQIVFRTKDPNIP